MPLIKCPDCQHDVSTDATACPHCGKPIKVKNSLKKPLQDQDVTTIQFTSKRLKRNNFIAFILIALATICLIGGIHSYINHNNIGAIIFAVPFVILFIAGITLKVITSIKTWWYHN